MGWLTGLFGGIGNAFANFFNWKEAQAETVQKSIQLIASIDNNDAQSVAALANSLSVILSQGSFLEKNWRAWLMTGLTVILFCSFFGLVPPHLNDTMTPMMAKIFELLQIGLGGYIVRRGIVDVIRMFNISAIIKALVDKRIA